MKPSILGALVLIGTSQGINVNHARFANDQDNALRKYLPDVPSYNISIPVDHFDSSNKNTYPNRYFVNDTYYKPGGPVIFFDLGESGFSPDAAADFLAEHNMTSAPLRLAAKTNGLVIGWEHRYYGYSRPVPMDDESGLPVDGLEGYKYLTIEQALEDTAYFANNFNKTTLSLNSNLQSTANLDPYHTPWIFVGGSYPGMRAAWARLKHPDIFYASWASSAPVQTQEDGSIYYNPIVRSMPQNCTNDIKAAVKFVDQTLSSGSTIAIQQVKTGIFLATNKKATLNNLAAALRFSNFEITADLTYALTFGSAFQSFGPYHSSRIMCDAMQGFDVETFTEGISESRTIADQNEILFNNPGGKSPTKDGIAASNGNNGGAYAFAALVYGMFYARRNMNKFFETLRSSEPFTNQIDDLSWSWQSLSQAGFFQGSNPNDISVISKFYNFTAVRDIQFEKQTFRGFSSSSFPKTLNNQQLLAMGGWNLTASNVMFTNGEFDPWRSFSVASQEKGAPNRKVLQTIPKCNALPQGSDVFGLVYAGAVHVEDMATRLYQRGSAEKTTPLQQGLELFLNAWDTWKPCFNQSRDDVRNGHGVDGKGNGANGSSEKNGGKDSGATGVKFSVMSVLAMTGVAALFSSL